MVRNSIRAVSASESGRGLKLSDKRRIELEDWCYAQYVRGVPQHIICQAINATKSRVSRWIISAHSRHGDARADLLLETRRSEIDRLMARVTFEPNTGCWLWLGSLKSTGYGTAVSPASGHRKQAHRRIYELIIGSLDEHLVLDHLCRVRACVNPDHLEPVTQLENMRRSRASHGSQ